MYDVTFLASPVPIWVSIATILQLLLVVWFGFVLLLGSWKLFRFLIKWKP